MFTVTYDAKRVSDKLLVEKKSSFNTIEEAYEFARRLMLLPSKTFAIASRPVIDEKVDIRATKR